MFQNRIKTNWIRVSFPTNFHSQSSESIQSPPLKWQHHNSSCSIPIFRVGTCWRNNRAFDLPAKHQEFLIIIETIETHLFFWNYTRPSRRHSWLLFRVLGDDWIFSLLLRKFPPIIHFIHPRPRDIRFRFRSCCCCCFCWKWNLLLWYHRQRWFFFSVKNETVIILRLKHH